MFEFVNDVVLKVVSPLTTAGLGLVAPYARAKYRYRRTTKFWKPIASQSTLVVLGSHKLELEPARLVGFGDVRALDDLRAFFKDARMPMFDVNYDTAVTNSECERRDLVLIGGPKPNVLVQSLMTKCNIQLNFDEEGSYSFSLHDVLTDKRYTPKRDGGEFKLDYGILLSTPNPFAPNEDSRAVVFAGCYGYGTWAAMRMAASRDSALLRDARASSGESFECIIQTDIMNGEPTAAKFVVPPRPLSSS